MTDPARRYLRPALLAGACLALVGCTDAMVAELPFVPREKVNVVDTSYGAADAMVQSLKVHLPEGTPLVVGSLRNTNPRARVPNPPFNRRVPELIGTRLERLGYTVSGLDQELAASDVGVVRESLSAPGYGDRGEITGTYTIGADEVTVHIRIRNPVSGQTYAGIDYPLPLRPEVRKQLDPKGDVWTVMGIPVPNEVYQRKKRGQPAIAPSPRE